MWGAAGRGPKSQQRGGDGGSSRSPGASTTQGHGLWSCWLGVVLGGSSPTRAPTATLLLQVEWEPPPGQVTVAILRSSSWLSGGSWVLPLPTSQRGKRSPDCNASPGSHRWQPGGRAPFLVKGLGVWAVSVASSLCHQQPPAPGPPRAAGVTWLSPSTTRSQGLHAKDSGLMGRGRPASAQRGSPQARNAGTRSPAAKPSRGQLLPFVFKQTNQKFKSLGREVATGLQSRHPTHGSSPLARCC